MRYKKGLEMTWACKAIFRPSVSGHRVPDQATGSRIDCIRPLLAFSSNFLWTLIHRITTEHGIRVDESSHKRKPAGGPVLSILILQTELNELTV